MVSGGRKAGAALTEVIHCLQPGSIIRDALRPVRGEEDVRPLPVTWAHPTSDWPGGGGVRNKQIRQFSNL